jgi:hypothetical protein
VSDDNSPARTGQPSTDPGPRRPQAWLEATTALATVFGVMVQQGYPALYALLVTLALGVGGVLVARYLRDSSDGPNDGSSATKWAV